MKLGPFSRAQQRQTGFNVELNGYCIDYINAIALTSEHSKEGAPNEGTPIDHYFVKEIHSVNGPFKNRQAD